MPREEILKAERWLRGNLLAQELLKRSHIKEETLKAMLMHSWSEDATFETIAKRLGIEQPGAWKRWQRGRDAMMRSFYTIELALYAGVLEADIAEIMIDDLLDYKSLSRGEGNVDEIRDRIERRMVQLAKGAPRKK
jgi:hypothetical protein